MYKYILITTLLVPFFSYAQAVATQEKTTTNIQKNKILINDFTAKITPSKKGIKKNIQTKYFDITIHSKGAHITSFKHKNAKSKLKDNIELVNEDKFRFDFYKTSKSQSMFSNLIYKLSIKEGKDTTQLIASSQIIATIENTGTRQAKKQNIPLQISKVYTFYNDLHYWNYSFNIENTSNTFLNISDFYFIFGRPIGPQASKEEAPRASTTFYNFFYADGDLQSVSTIDSSGCSNPFEDDVQQYTANNIDYFGSSSRFMILTMQPLLKSTGVYYFKNQKEIHTEFKSIDLPPKSTTKIPFIVFTGPKSKDISNVSIEETNKYPILKEVHSKMYEAFNFGITAPIRDLIVWLLGLFYYLIPNYGWGILLFALLFKLVFYPLNQKQAESMKRMSVLQPELKGINEKYKNNPQEKQKKIMMLYKEHKINPISGCLPILIQIPIFIALYSAFSDSYELWKSPFISGWINDLSEPDTIYTIKSSVPVIGNFNLNILPLLMAVTQYLQGKLTMVTGDANQQKIMNFLPFILLLFFWGMPSGVTLYWTVQNVLSILQQVYTNKRESKKKTI